MRRANLTLLVPFLISASICLPPTAPLGAFGQTATVAEQTAGTTAQPAPAAATVTAKNVLQMIETLRAQFLASQNADGSWQDTSWNGATNAANGGHTALICWALLQAGQEPFSDPILRAVNSLMKTNMLGAYNRSLRCMVLSSLARIEPSGKYARAMQADAEFLLQSRLTNGRWSYVSPSILQKANGTTPDRAMVGDNSNTQFAVLALREAAVAGAPVTVSNWRSIRDYWQGEQNEDGGFGYQKGGPGTSDSYGSMTAAGTASMFIAEDMVRGAQCCKGELPTSIAHALAWLSANFIPHDNPRMSRWWMYWLYSAERVAETSGYRYFGEHDWFWEGTAAIHKAYRNQQFAPGADMADQAMALIFLAKSVAPMVCNKLEFGDSWNPNPLDATHMTRYLAAEVFERHLNWQILKLDAPLAMYQEAPILLITTKTWPASDDPINPLLRSKIKEFCETGGTLLIDHTCTPDPSFQKNLDGFLEETWGGRRFRPLPANHPIYSAHFPLPRMTSLSALGNGCREYVLVCDDTRATTTAPATGPASGPARGEDLSCTWQKSLAKERPGAFQIAANLYMYATDKSFRNRIEPRSNLPRDPGLASVALPVARLQHNNNWNPCPLALPMLGDALKARAQLGLEVQPTVLDPVKLFGRRVLVITGQGKMEWTAEQIATVRDFIKGGGSVLGDALLGEKEFTESLRRLAAAALGTPARPIPENDPLITGKFSEKAFHLGKVQYSRTLRWRKGVTGPASLEGAKQDNRWAFVISPYDLTNGLTTAKPYGVQGYEPDDATRVAGNCMLYFAKNSGVLGER